MQIEKFFPPAGVTQRFTAATRFCEPSCPQRVLSLTLRLGGSGHELDAAAAMISKFLALGWGNTES
jgi:hypothetical protein